MYFNVDATMETVLSAFGQSGSAGKVNLLSPALSYLGAHVVHLSTGLLHPTAILAVAVQAVAADCFAGLIDRGSESFRFTASIAIPFALSTFLGVPFYTLVAYIAINALSRLAIETFFNRVNFTFALTSPAFEQGKSLPKKLLTNPPPLVFRKLPAGTHTLALVVKDLETDMIHWLVYNIPPYVPIEEGKTPQGACVGLNSWNEQNYHTLVPEKGLHRIAFQLVALTRELAPNLTAETFETAFRPYALARSSLIGNVSN